MIERLDEVITDLDLLNQKTEQSFFEIGGKIGEFIESVNLISSDLASLANFISGEGGGNPSNALAGALDRALEMEARYANGSGGLDGMRHEVGRLRHTLAEYKKTVSAFRAIGFLTRIEIGRLGNAAAEFGNLTEDVRSLAENVQARVQSALQAAAMLIPTIENAAKDIAALKEGQLKDLPPLISAVSDNLSSFREIQNRAHDSSVRLGARYASISNAFTKLIVSIQFHDITRQQVEHVIKVLRRIRSESEEESLGSCSEQPGTAAILTLQSLQLANAGEKFAGSVESLAGSLGEISDHVSKIAAESRELFSDSGDENDSFLLRMETGCSAILSKLSQCASAEAAAQLTSGSITETAARMRESIEEIRLIETQMFHVAINARINAKHLGLAGAPLDLLAGSMRQQAVESRQRSESLVKDLDLMREVASRLSERSGPNTAGEAVSEDHYSEQMRAAVAELHSSRERSFGQIPQIIGCTDRLREDLLATRANFSAGTIFAETIGCAQGTLSTMAGNSGPGLPPTGEALQARLANFSGNYTMQSEREVHQSVTGAANDSPLAGAAAEEEGGPDDNIEFF